MLIDFNVTITGTRDLLLHSSAGMNPRNPILQTTKPIRGRRGKNKTERVVESIEKADWLASGIWQTEGKVWLEGEDFCFEDFEQPVLPAEYLCRAAQVAATATKSGTKVKQALSEGLSGDAVILYDGPTKAENMWLDHRFVDCRSVVVQRNRIMRNRVRIPAGWQATLDLTLDSTILDLDEMSNILSDAGHRVGVGDYRPKFGRFRVTNLELVT